MSTKAAAKKHATKKVASASPSVSWIMLAKEFVTDRNSGSVSAINIVEDIFFPASAFGSMDEMNAVSVDHSLSLGFTVDWRWPDTYDAGTTVAFHLDWHAPSGNSFLSGGEKKPLSKPAAGNRTHVELKLHNLPIEDEGIYYFEVFLNDKSAAKYPVRIWATPEGLDANVGVPAVKKKRTVTKARAKK